MSVFPTTRGAPREDALTLSVRMLHPSATSDEISLLMQVPPSALQPVCPPSPAAPVTPHADRPTGSCWIYRLVQREDTNLTRAVIDANRWLAPRSLRLGDFLSSGGTIEYYVSVCCDDHFATQLNPGLMQLCATLGVTLIMDVFYE